MEGIDFSPLKDTLSSIATQLILWLAISAGAYILAFMILRLIKVPTKIAIFLSGTVFLFVMYYLFVNGFIPGIQ